jgi:putative ABC transport system permease protein
MGNLKLAIFLAYKSIIKGSRWTLALMILVMSLSFANLILTPSIMSGVTAAINQQQIGTLFGNILIDPAQKNSYLEQVGRITAQVAQTPGVAAVAPHLVTGGVFEYTPQNDSGPAQTQSGRWNVIGIDAQKEAQVTTIHNSLFEGSYLTEGETGQIVLGVDIAGGPKADNKPFLTLGGVKVGEQVRLTLPNGNQKIFAVKGIFKAKGGAANNLAYVSSADMVSLLGPPASLDSATQILIRTRAGNDDNQTLASLKTLGINGQIRSWLDYGGGVGGIVSSFGIIASLIGGIGLVVAGVVMFIVIYINVIHKKRQIGILRAIGITRNVVLASYMMQALLYAVLGIVVGGIIFGYGMVPYFNSHPIDLPIGLVSLAIDPTTIRNAIIGLLFAALLAGSIPVINITRHSIIVAIWGD